METIGMPEVLIILVVVILLFGVGRISKIGGELGGGIRAFREGLRGEEAPSGNPIEPASTLPPDEPTDQSGEALPTAALAEMISNPEGEHASNG